MNKNGKARECTDFHLRLSPVDTLDSQQNIIPEQEITKSDNVISYFSASTEFLQV
jgi:hypothetical protein